MMPDHTALQHEIACGYVRYTDIDHPWKQRDCFPKEMKLQENVLKQQNESY